MSTYADGKLRLSDSGSATVSRGLGRVEVSVDGEWGTVCDDDWNLNDATVVCRQLGYSSAWTAYYQPGEGLVKVEEPQCTGEEVTLLDCWTAQPKGSSVSCSHGRDVAVDCRSKVYGITGFTKLEVVHVTTYSIVLYILEHDYVNINTTFRIEVDGQYWAHTVSDLYTVSGLASDREYTIAVDVIWNGRRVRTLQQSARTRQLGECY